MTGASIETTLELWASSLREVKKRMRPLFEQERTALNAGLFVDGLLGDERRKTGWMRAEAAGDAGPLHSAPQMPRRTCPLALEPAVGEHIPGQAERRALRAAQWRPLRAPVQR